MSEAPSWGRNKIPRLLLEAPNELAVALTFDQLYQRDVTFGSLLLEELCCRLSKCLYSTTDFVRRIQMKLLIHGVTFSCL